MATTTISPGVPLGAQPAGSGATPAATLGIPLGGPVPFGWREGTLTRIEELGALAAWIAACRTAPQDQPLADAVQHHLHAAHQAACGVRLQRRRLLPWPRHGALLERARSNLDAAEAQILDLAPAWYVLGQLPSVVTHVKSHLMPTDARRIELERIAARLGITDPDRPEVATAAAGLSIGDKEKIVDEERGRIATALRAASSAALREHVRLRSFRNTVIATAAAMMLLALGVAVAGLINPTTIPLCFAPESAGQQHVVCPTAESPYFAAGPQAGATTTAATTAPARDIDDFVADTARRHDLLIVELIGLIAAAVAAAAAIRGIKGSSERCGVPIALALLKLPTGAITAFLGLLLMRGQFVPGLTALDTSAQILAWALIFGYGQQLFTRLVDRQAQTVLDSVRGAEKSRPVLTPQ